MPVIIISDYEEKQRKTTNLGINRNKDKERIYRYIEGKLGVKEKFCSRGRSNNNSKYNVEHTGENPAPIRQFNLQGAYIDNKNNVVIKNPKNFGLQPYCIKCERAYRRGRLNKWLGYYGELSEPEIYNNYRKIYGELATCSMCKTSKPPEDFQSQEEWIVACIIPAKFVRNHIRKLRVVAG
jgi:hypothetical protein